MIFDIATFGNILLSVSAYFSYDSYISPTNNKKLKISPAKLKKICKAIIEKLLTSGYKKIKLDSDYYWTIPYDEIVYTKNIPSLHCIG